MKILKLLSVQKLKVYDMVYQKNENFRDFQVFDFALYPRSKTGKSWRYCLPRILTLVVTQNLKTKKWTKTKTKSFIYDLEQKKNFRDFWVFGFAIYPKAKTRESRKVLFYLIFYIFTKTLIKTNTNQWI